MNKWPGYTSTEGFYDSPVMLGAKRIKLERSGDMPIDGLTEIDRPPRNGMIRLGIKKKAPSGKEYPAEVDYFILDPETPTEAEKKRIVDLFHEAFGKEPKVIEIMLLSSDINEAFPQNYKRYGKSTPLKCIGDGKTAIVTDKEWGRGLDQIGTDERGFMQVRCDGRNCIYATANDNSKNKECKATATLTVKIHQLGGLGVWQLTTGSFNSIVNINSGIRDLVSSYGRAHSIPLMLERRPQETPYKGKKTTHYTLHLNEAKNTAEAAMALQSNAEIDTTEVQAEILDGDIEPEKPIMINCPPVVEPPDRAESVKPDLQQELEKGVVGSVSEDVGDIKAAVDKEVLSDIAEMKAAVDREVLGDIAEATKNVFPKEFPKFMAFCKAKLEGKGIGDMYHETFKLYFVDNPLKLAHDTKKQGEIRVYLEALLEEQGLV